MLQKELSFALDAVRCAAAVCQAVQRRLLAGQTLSKQDKSPVTVADFASQAIVCRRLLEALSTDPLIGEEDSTDLRLAENSQVLRQVVDLVGTVAACSPAPEAVLDWIDHGRSGLREARPQRVWTLDPIDGTKGFMRNEQYAVALALLCEGRVELGVLGCPNLPMEGSTGTIFYALRGAGAFMLPLDNPAAAPARISVSDARGPAECRFVESVESGHSDQSRSSRIARLLGITRPALRMDSQAKYAAVARGDAQIYLRLPTRTDYQEKIWDHAAGCLITIEAGGAVTDIDGKPLDFSVGPTLAHNRGVVATCGPFHEAVVGAIRNTSA